MDEDRRDTDDPAEPGVPAEARGPVLKPEHLRRGGRTRQGSFAAGAGDGALSEAGIFVEAEAEVEAEVEVEGVVMAGVEHGSVVLTGADGRTWQLGRPHGHLVGCTVAVRGRRRDVMTTAQQGVPLEVLGLEVVAGTPGRPGVAPDRV